MSLELEATGERMIPVHHKGKNIYGAHIGRYQAGLSVIKNKVVLDIACGSGYGAKIMASEAKKIYGVDNDEDTIKYAKENYSAKNISYLVGDGTAIPLNDNSIDVVVSYETIEHIENYEGFMKEVKRVLRPEGLLVLSTPNDAEYMEGNHFHEHEFDYAELNKLVGKYFKHHEDYFQTLWYYSSILPKKLQTTEWQLPTDTISTIPLKPDECVFFFLLCSDKQIKEKINPIGVIGEHYRQRILQEESGKRKQMMQKLEERGNRLKEENEKLKELYNDVVDSESFKIGRAVLSPVLLAKKTLNKVKNKK